MRPLFYGDEENRTPDPLRAKQVLSQLSYTPVVSSKLNNYTYFPSLTSDSSDISFFQCHFLLRKEVFQPHLPIRLPCYDFTPVINPTFDDVLQKVRLSASGITDSHGVTGGVYKARERIHRSILICDY